MYSWVLLNSLKSSFKEMLIAILCKNIYFFLLDGDSESLTPDLTAYLKVSSGLPQGEFWRDRKVYYGPEKKFLPSFSTTTEIPFCYSYF